MGFSSCNALLRYFIGRIQGQRLRPISAFCLYAFFSGDEYLNGCLDLGETCSIRDIELNYVFNGLSGFNLAHELIQTFPSFISEKNENVVEVLKARFAFAKQ